MSPIIPQHLVEVLLNKVDIVELIASKIQIKKAGKNYQAKCPFHSEKTPSFVVFSENQNYYCFGCHAHGDAITFLREHDSLTYLESLEVLASIANMPWPPKESNAVNNQRSEVFHQDSNLLQLCAKFYATQLRVHSERAIAVNYLKARGVSGKIAKHFEIGFAPHTWDSLYQYAQQKNWDIKRLSALGLIKQNQNHKWFDMFRGRIMFPIRNRRGKVIGFGGRILGDGQPKYLNSQDSEHFHKSSVLYGLYEAKNIQNLKQILIVEGYMDVIALNQYGLTNALATLGTAFTEEHFKLLGRISHNITFCFDGDKAGRQAALKTLRTVFPLFEDGLNIKYLFLDEGEDPDSTIRKHSLEGFNAKLVGALPLSEYFIQACIQQHDDDSIDSKSRSLKVAREYLQLLPEGYFKAKLYDRLAKVLDVDPSVITGKLFNSNISKHNFVKKIEHAKPQTLTLIEKAIAYLLHKPEIALSLKDTHWLLADTEPDHMLLHDIIMLIRANSITKMEEIFGHLDGQRVKGKISMLSHQVQEIPLAGIETEFKDAFKRLVNIKGSKAIEELLKLSKVRKLSIEEKQRLQQLIQTEKQA